jgi:histidinol phosphatase-like enzyme (inositol monophosphatase family)
MYPEHVRLLQTLMETSGELIARYFRSSELEVETKSDESPVTVADREAEALMRDLIAKAFPEHGILGEEFGEERAAAEFVWTLDPIDGTISFAGGSPLFGTLVGLMHEGRPVLGGLHQPVLGQLCIGDGTETRLNGRAVRVRRQPRLSDATLLTTDIKYIGRYQSQEGFDNLMRNTGLFRTWGDCYGYLLVASGYADIMLDPVMSPWDIIPLIPIIEGAGGVISSWSGGTAHPSRSCVAAVPELHAEVIRLLNP